MAEKYPSANVRHVEGVAGDQGLDLFCGDLDCGPTVWQCKSFQVTLVGKSQKQQIKNSLRAAVESSSPRRWILCLNIDLDAKAHRWFQRLQSSYAATGVQIDLFQGSDIVHELIFRHTLRSHFFPNALLVDEVCKLIKRPESFAANELEMVPGEDIEHYIERVRAKDPRFIYEVTFGGEAGPKPFPPPPEPGLLVAVTNGRKTIKAYVRDRQALSLDPVGFSITLAETGVEKMESLIRTGQSQQFNPEEIQGFNTNVPLLSQLGLIPGEFDFSLIPLLQSSPIPLRLSFVREEERVMYDLLEFHVTRAGTDELEISTLDAALPFEIHFVFPTPSTRSKTCRTNINKRFAGRDARQVRKAAAAFRLLEAGCELELYSLTHEGAVGRIKLPPFKFALPEEAVAWIDMLASISEMLEIPINLPEQGQVDRQDYVSASLLHAAVTGGTVPTHEISINLVKSVENSRMLANVVQTPVSFGMVYPSAAFKLFGKEIYRGGYGIYLEKWALKSSDRTLRLFEEAKVGETVPISIRPLTPMRVFLTTQQVLSSET